MQDNSMVHFVFAMIGLFSCGAMYSMEACNDARLMPMVSYDQYNIMHDYHITCPINTKITKRYAAHGVDTVVIDGGKHGIQDGERIKLTMSQITDDHTPEEIIIQTEKHIAPCITVNHNGAYLEVGLRPIDHIIFSLKDILIHIALKKYAKIVTSNYVDTTLSMIQAEKIYLEVEDNCAITTENNTQLIANYLAVNNKGKSNIDLCVDTQLLHVNNDHEGIIVLSGCATEQDIVLFDGSFDGHDIKSEKASVVIGDGGGKIFINARKQITGCLSQKSKHDITFRNLYRSTYLEAWDSIKPIDFKENDELSYT
jgi:hypothetical protein